jgi:heat-inducible transcriptional repressor
MAPESADEQLSDRAQYLLRVLVESYIREGQPVGSRTLTRDSGLNLSSATVRNVMADLEEYGFVASPHTSAGRVPTDKGYRFFVDTLLKRGNVESIDDAVSELRRRLDDEQARDPKAIVAVASQVLSSITHLAGVVTMPRRPEQSLSQIEFLPLSDNRVLAVMVVNGRDVQNRIVQLERYYTAEELRRAANFLNQQFSGKALSRVRADIVEELKQAGERLNQLMLDAIRVAQQMVSEDAQAGPEYVIAGETNLMEFAELSKSYGACSTLSPPSATSCTCSTRACAPMACRSSSATNRATRSSTISAWSRPPTCSTSRRWAYWESLARRGWPTSGSSRSSTSRPGCWARP